MENLNLALFSSPASTLLASRSPITRHKLLSHSRSFSYPLRNYRHAPARICNVARRSSFGSVSSSSSSGRQTASVGVNPPPVPPPPSQVGSPLFWIGVGVGFSALFSWVASYLKKYAMQQAFKTMMNQTNTQNNQFSNSPFPAGSPFQFPLPTAPGSANPPFFTSSPRASPATSAPATDTTTSTSSFASQTSATVDIPAAEVAPVPEPVRGVTEETKKKDEQKKYSFVDVSPEDSLPQTPFSSVEDDTESFKETISQNGVIPSPSARVSDSNQSTRKAGSILTVDALEKMLEDPTIQQLVYPSLPEDLRNPASLKWMLQNPQYRQQMEQMLNEMSGSMEWDDRMLDTLKNFDLNSPEVKQQFEQVGLTPQEAISKIIANPDVATAFQNPRVQQAILDISQNPMNIAKYEHDREVMDVIYKISELFPGGGLP